MPPRIPNPTRSPRSERLASPLRYHLTLGVVLLLGVGACGTSLEDALSGVRLLPDPSIISADVHGSCDELLTEDEILSSILAARIDQSNGATKQEELTIAFQNCAIDALLGGPDISGCNACKRAILDQVFGE